VIYALIGALDEAPPVAMPARRKRHAPPALDSDADGRVEAELPGLARCPNVHTFPMSSLSLRVRGLSFALAAPRVSAPSA